MNHYKIDHEDTLRYLKFPFELETSIDERFSDKIKFNAKKFNWENAKKQTSSTNENKLTSSSTGYNCDIVYKIPFEKALSLVASKDYFLYKGYIYVFKKDLRQIIETVFKESILAKLENFNKYYDTITQDQRILNILNSFNFKREGKFPFFYFFIFALF